MSICARYVNNHVDHASECVAIAVRQVCVCHYSGCLIEGKLTLRFTFNK